jgi:hypothetical protein
VKVIADPSCDYIDDRQIGLTNRRCVQAKSTTELLHSLSVKKGEHGTIVIFIISFAFDVSIALIIRVAIPPYLLLCSTAAIR